MIKFVCKVKNPKNIVETKIVFATSMMDAANQLEKSGFIVLEIQKTEELTTDEINLYKKELQDKNELSLKRKKMFFKAFYNYYKSGKSISETFRQMKNYIEDRKIKAICIAIYSGIDKGQSLKEILTPMKSYLGYAYTTLIIAGEKSGQLDDILLKITENLEKEEKTRNSVIMAMIYPVLIFLLAIVVNQLCDKVILRVFATMATSYTCPTSIIINLIKTFFITIIQIGLVIGLGIYFIRKYSLNHKIIDILTKFSIFKPIVHSFSFINYFFIMSMAVESALPITDAMFLGNSIIKVDETKRNLDKALKRLLNGANLYTTFATTDLFGNDIIQEIAIGEETGELDTAFRSISEKYEKKLDVAVQSILKVINPLLIIIVGIIVARIAIKFYGTYFNSLFSIF